MQNTLSDRPVPIAFFLQGRIRHHVAVRVYASALRRRAKQLGLTSMSISYAPGLINEANVCGYLLPGQWRSVAAWSDRWFPTLRIGHRIASRLSDHAAYGQTGDEIHLQVVQADVLAHGNHR
jgi:hypothetical protein